ncbi:MAG: diacylglycerol acyltransferase [Monoraphidium minutum]|nr:MAG: diacylglycerol acyltransferase [Monoraphidium minutum]
MLSPLHLSDLSRADTRDTVQRLICLWFGLTVIGQLWTWPLALLAAWHSAVFAGLLALYVAYIFGPGLKASEEEGPTPLRRLGIWRIMGERFSARLVKTADLDPSRRYVFACYPHGVSAVSGWLMFATEAGRFSELFPGLRAWPCTLESNFKAPFVREYCLLHGLRSCARRAIANLLKRPGNAAVLFPGGASEAVEAAEGENRVILGRRKGFARLALQAGADLVPVACFGESDLFHVYVPAPGSLGHKFQSVSHHFLPGRQPLFWGDGWEAAVDGLHARYCDELRALWEAWREKAAPGRAYAPLTVVG